MKQSSDVPKVWVVDSEVSQDELTTQVQFLMKENEALKKRTGALENEVQGLKQNFAHYTQAAPQSQAKSQSQTEGQGHEAKPSQVENQGQSLEAQLRLDLAWMDEPCPFKKATGRSWREMAENEGEKIAMNGKGFQVPRA